MDATAIVVQGETFPPPDGPLDVEIDEEDEQRGVEHRIERPRANPVAAPPEEVEEEDP